MSRSGRPQRRKGAPVRLADLPASVQKLNADAVAAERDHAGRPIPQTAHAKSSATASARGGSFEASIEADIRASYLVRRVDHLDARKIERKRKVTARIPAGADFVGIYKTGKGFAVEAKSTRGKSVFASKLHAQAARQPRAPRLTPKQVGMLDDYSMAAVALLAVRYGKQVCVFRWCDVKHLGEIRAESAPFWPTIGLALEAMR